MSAEIRSHPIPWLVAYIWWNQSIWWVKLVLWLAQKQDSPRSTGLSSCSFFKIAIICGVLGTVQRKTPHIYIYIITYFIGIILPTRNLHLYIPTVTPCISPIMDDCSGSKPIKRSIYLHYISRCFSPIISPVSIGQTHAYVGTPNPHMLHTLW